MSRIFIGIQSELEWKYLVNETLIGERAIIPLLEEVKSMDGVSRQLQEDLSRQIEEEQDHVALFEGLVGKDSLSGSGYDNEFKEYVRNQSSVTLRIFALQGMLEGIALGALAYRRKSWPNSPSFLVDTKALREEAEHVGVCFPHFSKLINTEGVLKREDFRKVSREVNGIFRKNFSKGHLEIHLPKEFSFSSDAFQVSETELVSFRAASTSTVANACSRFMQAYQEAAFSEA